jgi:hypothetical protein
VKELKRLKRKIKQKKKNHMGQAHSLYFSCRDDLLGVSVVFVWYSVYTRKTMWMVN